MLTQTRLAESSKAQKEFNVLYVDDEFINLRLFEMAFKRHYNVFVAENGHQALDILREKEIQLIITDQKMPKMTGTELLESTIHEFPDVIRIILTGYADIESIVRAINRCKIYKYITKPYDQSDMKLTLDKALEFFKVSMENRELIEELSKANMDLERKVEERTSELQVANQRLTDGLVFAQTIQETILPKEADLADRFGDAFVIYQPKDFVGGDFFWHKALTVGERNLDVIAVVDCMGHGVAGALLSMIGESQLRQIISEVEAPGASGVLSRLDEELRKVLSRGSNSSTSSATMDVTLVIVDRDALQMEFSGAKLDLVFFRNGELERIKGTRKSVGSDWEEKLPFESHVLNLEGVSELYMYSDGFQDQFDADNSRKFGSKNLLELIKKSRSSTLSAQKTLILQALNDWKKDNDQVDDITLIGISI